MICSVNADRKDKKNMNNMNLTVGKLKDIIKYLPNNMEVIIPVTIEEDANYITSFRHVKTMGIVSNEYEEQSALCLNSAQDGLDINGQLIKNGSDTVCDKILF